MKYLILSVVLFLTSCGWQEVSYHEFVIARDYCSAYEGLDYVNEWFYGMTVIQCNDGTTATETYAYMSMYQTRENNNQVTLTFDEMKTRENGND